MKRFLAALLAVLIVVIGGAQPAGAVIGPDHWQFGTIYVQNVTPSHAWSPAVQNRVLYYHNIGAHWDVRYGNCVTGYPCIRLAIAAYGNTGWAGLTAWPLTCANSDTWCNFRGNINDSNYMAKVFINTSGGEQSDGDILTTACHELGHALASLGHLNTSASCMYPDNYPPSASWLTDGEKQQIRDRFAGILLGP